MSAANTSTDKRPQWIREHLTLYAEDPDRGHYWDATWAGGKGPTPCLLLTTTGRKSGAARTTPLIYARSGAGYCVIASKGGAPAHPGWYLNLQASPEAEVQVARERFRVRARVAEGAERERLWSRMAELFPPYDEYAAKTDREIPVVVLEPV